MGSVAVNILVMLVAMITGEPPAFPSTDDPRDQFAFERDADGNPVSLTFICPVTGSDPPVIDW